LFHSYYLFTGSNDAAQIARAAAAKILLKMVQKWLYTGREKVTGERAY